MSIPTNGNRKSKKIDIKRIAGQWLKDNGYDGLTPGILKDDVVCTCGADDLESCHGCAGGIEYCYPAYLATDCITCNEKCYFAGMCKYAIQLELCVYESPILLCPIKQKKVKQSEYPNWGNRSDAKHRAKTDCLSCRHVDDDKCGHGRDMEGGYPHEDFDSRKQFLRYLKEAKKLKGPPYNVEDDDKLIAKIKKEIPA